MRKYADLRRSERQFEKRDWVYLHLQPYKQLTVAARKNLKLFARFYGLFQVTEKIGSMAYRLELPPQLQIHPVFHISQLKKKLGVWLEPIQQLPLVNATGAVKSEPAEVLSRWVIRLSRLLVTEVLVRWQGQGQDDATWEKLQPLLLQYPHLVGKVL